MVNEFKANHFDISTAIDNVPGIELSDLRSLKMTVEKTLHPEKTNREVHDKYFPDNTGVTESAKQWRVSQTMKHVKTKYPEIFKPFRDSDILNMNTMVKDLRDMALNPENKVGDRIKAHKVILDTAVQAEKFSKDKQIDEKTLETIAFDDKSFGDIIRETRQKYAQ